MSYKFIILLFLFVALISSACNHSNTPSSSTSSQPTTAASPAASPKTGFEADLDYVRKGQYTYVWVFSRKDGKAINREDAAYLRTNAPQVVDWVTSDEGKKVIAGTNFDLAEGNLELIKKRFNVEDYSAK